MRRETKKTTYCPRVLSVLIGASRPSRAKGTVVSPYASTCMCLKDPH
jgi:hypothetical protein